MPYEVNSTIVDCIKLKHDTFLTRTNHRTTATGETDATATTTPAVFNLGNPDNLRLVDLTFLELTATLILSHGGIFTGKPDWTPWQWTAAMAQAL